MKNVFLALTLVLSVSASMFADVHIHSKFIAESSTIGQEQSSTQEFVFFLRFRNAGDQNTALIGRDNKFEVTHIVFSIMTHGVELGVVLHEKNSDGKSELVYDQALVIPWDKETIVYLKDEDGQGFESKSITTIVRKQVDGDLPVKAVSE